MTTNPHALRADRHDLFMKAENLIAAAKKSGKDLDGADLAKHNSYLAEIRQIDAELERIFAAHPEAGANAILPL